ncbi:hypothetical protein SAMN05216232_2898 [Virgibacillus subterraneus]|uniref:Peptidyl-prolyl cis-trans isomerase n=1 Tax=Virgibacillus subterraneus TaxID=621109 RepID=A0A1H9HJE4_9BACI|nr:hypothetical protein [Virgibacillus subterraneus]SEQ62366.1 hypothetical protein SAMN05216232_2898 [Virgibacillus subterraneus]
MIVPIIGNVTYSITLDPTVWIFDDRKILLEEAFTERENVQVEDNELENASKRWSRAVYQQKINPPVNKSISRFEREKILENSYVMPINEFVDHAEVNENATDVTIVTSKGDEHISLEALQSCYLLFAVDGKPLKEEGPVHLFYKDGSNKDNPITGIEKIVIN